MLIGSNKTINNCEIFEDIHIYDAEKVVITHCKIWGNIITHESCKELVIHDNVINGTLIAFETTNTNISNCRIGSENYDVKQARKIFKDSCCLIKEARLLRKKDPSSVDRTKDLILDD